VHLAAYAATTAIATAAAATAAAAPGKEPVAHLKPNKGCRHLLLMPTSPGPTLAQDQGRNPLSHSREKETKIRNLSAWLQAFNMVRPEASHER